MRRLLKDKSALVSLAVLLVFAVACALAPWIAPRDPLELNLQARFQLPNSIHWLGTDSFGRDLLSRILYGGRVSLTASLLSVITGLLGGTILGMLAGYFKQLDNPIMRVVDVLMSFPRILLAMLVVGILGPSLANAVVAVAVGSIPHFARLCRSLVMSASEAEYCEGARAVGSSHLRIMVRQILPNIAPPMLVFVGLMYGQALLTISVLGFLGLGAQAPSPEWGAMASDGRQFLRQAPYLATLPSLAIFAVVLSLNVIGDSFRDALDPRLR